jgi:hypothetical protein
MSDEFGHCTVDFVHHNQVVITSYAGGGCNGRRFGYGVMSLCPFLTLP